MTVVHLLAACTVQSMNARIQHSCALYMTSHTIYNKMSHLHTAATIRKWLLCRHAVAKVRLLFRAAYIQDFVVPVYYRARHARNTSTEPHSKGCEGPVYYRARHARNTSTEPHSKGCEGPVYYRAGSDR